MHWNIINKCSHVVNTPGDRRRDRLPVYSLQAIGRRDYANEHQSQRDALLRY